MANEGISQEAVFIQNRYVPLGQVGQYLRSSIRSHRVLQNRGLSSKGKLHSGTRPLHFHCILGNGLPMEDTYDWLETGKFKRWMSWWYLKNCTSFHFPGPKVINLRRHSDERDTAVLTHQWQTSSNREWYPNTVKESNSGPHMRSVKNSYNSLLV